MNDETLSSEIAKKRGKMRGLIKKYQKCMENRKIVVDILVILFGIGAWVGVNGMFVQLPLLVQTAPEEWKLPSHMSITVQIANLGPVLYAIYRRFWPKKLNDAYCIYLLLFIGVVSSFLMAFLYDYVIVVGGEPRSTVFLILVFFTAIVGCTSSVLFFPFMRHYKEMYLITYLIGEGLSGFIPSIVALIQGVGNQSNKEALFGPRYFFLFVFLILLLSFTAFILLNNLKVCNLEKVSIQVVTSNNKDIEQKYYLKDMTERKEESIGKDIFPDTESVRSISLENSNNKFSKLKSTSLLILMALISGFANGVFPSIQSYSCLPYGYTAYHLAVTLGNMANPIACFLAVFLPHTSNRSISYLSSLCAVLIAYVLTTSIMSPTPPLVDTVAGVVIVIVVWIFVVGLVSYIKLCISTIFRSAGGSWMFYCGCASQMGSAVGSLIFFFLINYANIFHYDASR